MKHIAYPSIEQYRNAIRQVADHSRYAGRDANGDPVFDHTKPLPTLKYRGTVKLHGTNAGVVFDRGAGEFWAQSRENIITPAKDNAGFATFAYGQKEKLAQLTEHIPGNELIIFGEWCGGSIQKGVAIAQLTKRFVIFGVQVDGKWLDDAMLSTIKEAADSGIHNILDYPSWEIDIDFNNPEQVQNKLVELTLEIERECPVAKAMGATGIGEGIVWKCTTPGWEDPKFYFKVKGEKHQSSKTTTLAPVDIEKVNSIKAFAVAVATESRCRQAVEKLKAQGVKTDRTCLGLYVKWINDDIVKEDTDTAVASGIELQKAFGEINKVAKAWFFAHELEF